MKHYYLNLTPEYLEALEKDLNLTYGVRAFNFGESEDQNLKPCRDSIQFLFNYEECELHYPPEAYNMMKFDLSQDFNTGSNSLEWLIYNRFLENTGYYLESVNNIHRNEIRDESLRQKSIPVFMDFARYYQMPIEDFVKCDFKTYFENVNRDRFANTYYEKNMEFLLYVVFNIIGKEQLKKSYGIMRSSRIQLTDRTIKSRKKMIEKMLIESPETFVSKYFDLMIKHRHKLNCPYL